MEFHSKQLRAIANVRLGVLAGGAKKPDGASCSRLAVSKGGADEWACVGPLSLGKGEFPSGSDVVQLQRPSPPLGHDGTDLGRVWSHCWAFAAAVGTVGGPPCAGMAPLESIKTQTF
jgi:hypothetical protein